MMNPLTVLLGSTDLLKLSPKRPIKCCLDIKLYSVIKSCLLDTIHVAKAADSTATLKRL